MSKPLFRTRHLAFFGSCTKISGKSGVRPLFPLIDSPEKHAGYGKKPAEQGNEYRQLGSGSCRVKEPQYIDNTLEDNTSKRLHYPEDLG